MHYDTYRPAGRKENFLIFVMFLVIVGAAAAVFATPIDWMPKGVWWKRLEAVMRMAALVVLIIILVPPVMKRHSIAAKQRRSLTTGLLESHGFRTWVSPDGPEIVQKHDPGRPDFREVFRKWFTVEEETLQEMLSPLDKLRRAYFMEQPERFLAWIASQEQKTAGARVMVYEYEATGNVDPYATDRKRTVAAWPAELEQQGQKGAALGNMPMFMVSRLRLNRRKDLQGFWQKPLPKEQSAFAAGLGGGWRVYGNAATGAKFLTPDVQQILRNSPPNELWFMGAGWVFCIYCGFLDAKGMTTFLDRGRRVLELARPA